ncbi:hypothetical protein BCR43DRAFT_491429 [Syncephalastrum racemosum]|uniref:BZIP domain-containing protein n=1 Tax=Syncephalastrum racemosum TaxID=13706 RepID=A0A1X2HBV3_SYNRA|nr:hypothetical protein BCR43DRAFT_491429 [Syncephalastrum racemosum]
MVTPATMPSLCQPSPNRPMAISAITSPTLASFAEDDGSIRADGRRIVMPRSITTHKSADYNASASSFLSSTTVYISCPPSPGHASASPQSFPSTLSSPVFSSATAKNKDTSSSLLMMTTPPPQHFYAASSEISAPPLSLQERRQRNKAASAKYRAKKNQQHCEMRRVIASLTRENELLQRQLDHVARENRHLKATCDRLRGKMLAERMLQRLLKNSKKGERHPGHLSCEEIEDVESEEDMDAGL